MSYARTKVDELTMTLVRFNAPTPEVAKALARCFDPASQTFDTRAQETLSELSEILFGARQTEEQLFEISRGEMQMVWIDELYLGSRSYETEWELKVSQSIRENGLYEPIICIQVSDSTSKLRVWDGTLRVQACHLFGWKRIPAYVYPKDIRLTRTM